jgi:hypothetical protein
VLYTFSVATIPGTHKSRSFVLFWRKSTVITFPLEIFRRLSTPFTPFYTPNAVHDTFSVETIPDARKSRSLANCWRKSIVISLKLDIFRRLNAHFTSFYTSNAVHAPFSVETIPGTHKTRPFFLFWRKATVISLQLEIFRRLNAHFTSVYTPNAVHETFSVETIPDARKSRSLVKCWRKSTVISFKLDIFRRLTAHFSPFYTPNAVHLTFSVATIPGNRKTRSFVLF